MEKNKIISLSTTLLYSFVLVISFLCFYHSIVESSWLLEIIVSLFVLIGVNLLSYKTKTKEIIFPIVMTFIIGIIYSFQSFYYGFWGIINYCIQWYNVQFDDARNLMMTKAITTSHIQAFSLVVILFITYFIYRSIKKEKMMGIILIFSIVFAFTLWIDRFSFIGGSLCIITLLMIWMYYQNKVINSKTVQWLVIISIIFVAVALPVYQDNLSLQQIKKEVLQQVEDLRYGKDNLPQGNLKQASNTNSDQQKELSKLNEQLTNLQTITQTLSKYPQIDKNILETIDSISFNQETGAISLTVTASKVNGCEETVRTLRESGTFKTVDYNGYTQDGGVSETTETVTDPTTGATTTQAVTNTTPITYKSSITCTLEGGTTSGQD